MRTVVLVVLHVVVVLAAPGTLLEPLLVDVFGQSQVQLNAARYDLQVSEYLASQTSYIQPRGFRNRRWY